jgi:hypothetical protein
MRACLLIAGMLTAINPAQAQFPSPTSCLTRGDKLALAAGVRAADAVKDSPESHLTWQEAGVIVGFPPALNKQVTPENLYLYPFNQWTLQSTRRFTRTASTLSEHKDVNPIPEKLDNALLNTNLTINGASHNIADYANRTFTDALVIVKDGNLVRNGTAMA